MATLDTDLRKAPQIVAGLSETQLLDMYRDMCLSRALFERMWLLQRSGKTPFVVTAEGQEAAQVGAAHAMDREIDTLVPYYRDVGMVLVWGMTPREIMLNVLGRAEDPCGGGRQLPNHFGHPSLRIVSQSSPVATQVPHAVGIALAQKMRREGSATICCFGEGGTSTGDFHEGLNFAGIHRLPVIFFCENNGYAISVPYSKQTGVRDVADKAEGYGFPGVTIDGNDIIAVYQAVKKAADRARAGEGPTLIEAKTYRYAPHTSNDDPSRYRTKEETELWRGRDPIPRFRDRLKEWGLLDEEREGEVREEVEQAVNDATRYAEGRPLPTPETALDHVYAA